MVNTDVPTSEEIKKYLAGVKSATGLTYYDENMSASRLHDMCLEGRKKIRRVFTRLLTIGYDEEGVDDFDKELVEKGHIVYFSIPLGSSSPPGTKDASSPEQKQENPSGKKGARPPDSERARPPSGTENKEQGYYYDVEPNWKGEIAFTEESQILADALKISFERNEVGFKSLTDRCDIHLRCSVISEADDLNESEKRVYFHFSKAITDPCKDFFKAAGSHMIEDDAVENLRPDVAIYDDNGTVLVLCEIKRMGLSKYIDDSGELKSDEIGLNSILKQVCLYLIKSKVHFCFISDFKTTILIELDFPADGDTDDAAIIDQENSPPKLASQGKQSKKRSSDSGSDQIGKRAKTEGIVPKRKAPRKGKKSNQKAHKEEEPESKSNQKANKEGEKHESRKVPFKYRIIRSSDIECTLQEAFHSLVYYQYWLKQNSSDPDVKAQIEARVAATAKLKEKLLRPKDEVVAEKVEIMQATSIEHIVPIHKNIDKGRFKDPVVGNGPQWDGFDLLQGKPYTNQVYSFDFETLASLFPSFTDRLSGNKPQGKVVLKLYDMDYVEDNFDQRKYWDWRKTEYCAAVKLRYFHEVECYERIRKHNSTASATRVNIPEVYDYGYLTFCDESSYLFGAFFILMEYVESQPGTARQSTFRSGYSQIKTLGELGICHNDIAMRNIRIVDSRLFLFDFSHAECAEEPVNSKYDLHELKVIEDQIFGDA